MATFDLKAYARRGAEARLAELNDEIRAIYAAFPDLRGRGEQARPCLGSNNELGTLLLGYSRGSQFVLFANQAQTHALAHVHMYVYLAVS